MSVHIDTRAERHIAYPLIVVALVAAATIGQAAGELPAEANATFEVASGVRGVTAIRNSLTIKQSEAGVSATQQSKQ